MCVCTQVGVPVLWIPTFLQRWRMLMLTVTLSHAPDIFTPAPENRTSFFSNHIRIIWPVTSRSLCLLKLHDNNSCSAAFTRQNTLGWHIPSRSCAAQTAIWSNYLAHRLFLKLRHSSAESDVADEKKSPQESRVIYIPAEEFSLLHTLIALYTSNLCLGLSAEQNVDSICCRSRAILTFWQDKTKWHQ